MNSNSEKIQILNKMVAMIDEKAAKYKNERKGMHPGRVYPEKKLVLDLIDDGLKLADSLQPKPADLISDLKRLWKTLSEMT
ncbi:MAG: hypothetical protein K8R21_06840 [Leptospira sp.]|nr:hypothetical protein [Leptospira sp.]